jgi:hypothetical protein
MTTPDPHDDAALDARVRAAADVPFDDIAVSEAVLSRVHTLRRTAPTLRRTAPTPRRRSGWLAIAAPATFASVLVATPFVIASYPGTGGDTMLLGFAAGDPLALIVGAGLGRDLISAGLTE